MYTNNFIQVGKNIQTFLSEKGKTQQNLADAMGISKQVMSKIINGNKAINVTEIAKIAEFLEVSVDDIKTYKSYMTDITSLDIQVGDDDDGTTIASFIEDEKNVSPEKNAVQIAEREMLDAVLDTLTAREQDIIRQRFGLDGNVPKTLEEVGKSYGLTKERIRQIENKALMKLRQPSRARMLRDLVTI